MDYDFGFVNRNIVTRNSYIVPPVHSAFLVLRRNERKSRFTSSRVL